MTESNVGSIKKQIAALERMTVGQLRERYAEVFGEPARSGNRQWPFARSSAGGSRPNCGRKVWTLG